MQMLSFSRSVKAIIKFIELFIKSINLKSISKYKYINIFIHVHVLYLNTTYYFGDYEKHFGILKEIISLR